MNPLIFLLLASLIDLGRAKATEINQFYVKCHSKIQQERIIRFDLGQDKQGALFISRFLFISPNQNVEAQQVHIDSVVGTRGQDSILPFSFLKMSVDAKTIVLATNDGNNYFLTYNTNSFSEPFLCDIGAPRPGVIVSN